VQEMHFGPLRLLSPNPGSVDFAAAALAALAMLSMFRFKLGLPKTLAGSAALGILWKLVS
jgi:chromate transporter